MSGLKENLQIQTEGTILAAQQAGFSFKNSFALMPKWRRVIILTLLIAIIPGYLLARIGTEQLQRIEYSRQALIAHPAFTAAVQPDFSPVTLIRNPNGTYSAYATVTNPNLDLAAEDIPYTMTFQSSGNPSAFTSSGTFYLLPDEKRYLVVPKIDTTDNLISGTLSLGEAKWQKKLSIPKIDLKASEPITSEDINPQTFYVEGAVINNSPYNLSAVRIVFLLYDQNNNIIGVSQRDEFQVAAFSRRAYKQQWPGLTQNVVRKVQVIPATDVSNPDNLKINTNTNSSPDPRENNSNSF